MNELKKIAFEKLNYEFSGQVQYFARCIISEIFEHCENTLYEYVLTEENVEEAVDLILDLQLCLNRRNDHAKMLYECFNWNNGLLQPWSDDVFFIDLYCLEDIISRYLSFKWLSSATLEWYLINPYLRFHINNYRNVVFNDRFKIKIIPFPETFLEHSCNFIINKIFILSFYWLLYVASLYIINALFENEWPVTALFLSFGYLYFLICDIIGFVVILRDKKLSRRTLFNLVDLKVNISAKSWSPTKIMEKITVLEKNLNIPELSPLVSKMIKRDPEIFNSFFGSVR